ncbi:MAG TPA: ester cyclase [Ktedonobacteraceae bacterium]|nr:ester cyclase [Ktedonobacteraceae bacterium]
MSAAENKAIVRKYLDEAWTKRNVDILDELMAPNYARYLPGQDKPLDREAQKKRIAGFFTAMPDLVFLVEDLFAEEDRVVFRVMIRGTHDGTFLGVAPTGKQLTVTAIDIARLENGKIVDHWGQMDMAGLMQQLDLIS